MIGQMPIFSPDCRSKPPLFYGLIMVLPTFNSDATGVRENALARVVRSNQVKGWLSWLMLPFCFWQGLRVRSNGVSLVPPSGPAQMLVGDERKGTPYRVLVVGDSSVSGIGATDIEEGLAMQMATQLSQRLNRPIDLRIAGNASATSENLRDHVVRHLPRDAFDLVFLVIGMNDAKNFHSSQRFVRGLGGLIYALNTRFPSALVAHWPISPMTIFPVLPQPLKTCLTLRSDILDAIAACLSAGRGVERFERQMELPDSSFAADGFHLNAQGYALWADIAVKGLMSKDAVRAAKRKRKKPKAERNVTPSDGIQTS